MERVKIEISGTNEDIFKVAVENIMNTASVMCSYGYLPTKEELENKDLNGLSWTKEDGKFNIFPRSNNNWFNIEKEDKMSIIGSFNCRYDSDGKKRKLLTDMALILFDNYVKVVE